MKEKKIFDAITNIPDELVEEARTTNLKQKSRPLKTWSAIAVCAALITGLIIIPPYIKNDTGNVLSNDLLPANALLNVVFPKAYAFEDFDTRREIFTGYPVKKDFLSSLNDFSYETAAQIFLNNQGNINYSPLSLYYALATATLGAEDETADELLSLLGVSDKTVLSEQCRNLYNQLYTDNEIGKLKIATSLWMDDNINWKNDYIQNVADNLYAHSFSVDFKNNTTSQLMSKWVFDNTNGTLAPDMTMNPDQILSIINTVYFYDEWTDKFNESVTKDDIFYLSDNDTVNCDFMNKTNPSQYFVKGDGYTRSVLSLKNSGSMIFILPDEDISPRELLASADSIKEIFEGGEGITGEVVWQVPKFNFGTKLDLIDMLNNLGVKSAFEENANFSGITDNMAFISNIQQETHIGIDENGVEASAYTQIVYCGSALPQDRADMILNRPFIYGITNNNGTLLFVGICENPVSKN